VADEEGKNLFGGGNYEGSGRKDKLQDNHAVGFVFLGIPGSFKRQCICAKRLFDGLYDQIYSRGRNET
jgi:hypothetical protein